MSYVYVLRRSAEHAMSAKLSCISCPNPIPTSTLHSTRCNMAWELRFVPLQVCMTPGGGRDTHTLNFLSFCIVLFAGTRNRKQNEKTNERTVFLVCFVEVSQLLRNPRPSIRAEPANLQSFTKLSSKVPTRKAFLHLLKKTRSSNITLSNEYKKKWL